MNKIDRSISPKPACLIDKADEWRDNFIKKIKKAPSYWNWHQYNKEKVVDILTKGLSIISHFHCSYCGIFPLKQSVGGRSIDHFKPKSKFPELAFEWENLFIACSDCQQIKGNNYPSLPPLKPDHPNYKFDYWFKINWVNNHIVPRASLTAEEQAIAQATLDWLGLNKGERPTARFDELEKFNNNTIKNVLKWSYPYFLEAGKI